MSALTARGDLSSNLITWIIALLIGLIVVIWFVKNNPFGISKQAELLNEDLTKINELIMRACNRNGYRAVYNPLTETGNITFSESDACIMKTEDGRSLRRCIKLSCNISGKGTFELANITYIEVRKEGVISVGAE